jgi:hypothetical protein
MSALWGLLKKHRDSIVALWREATLDTYPTDATNFLKKSKDPFHNPVGKRINEGLAQAFDVLADQGETVKVTPFIDDVIRMRAVQDFSPSQAIGFLFLLKGIILEQLKKDAAKIEDSADWRELDAKIDGMALLGMDIYNTCKEKIYSMRVHEVRNQCYNALKKSNLIVAIEDMPDDAT